jgi:membrane-associated phospholipid phosphatase
MSPPDRTRRELVCFKCANSCDGVGVLDVTIPSNASTLEYIAVFWSFMPYACTLLWIIFTLVGRTSTAILGYLLSGLIAGVSELTIKNALARDRPPESCLESYGAPSTHSTFALAWFTWLYLEAYYHRKVFLPHRLAFVDLTAELTEWPWDVPLFRKYIIFLAVALLPIPLSRVIVKDHSDEQAVGGAIFGFCWAWLIFLFMHKYGQKWLTLRFIENVDSGTKRWWGIKDDYCHDVILEFHMGRRPGAVKPFFFGSVQVSASRSSVNRIVTAAGDVSVVSHGEPAATVATDEPQQNGDVEQQQQGSAGKTVAGHDLESGDGDQSTMTPASPSAKVAPEPEYPEKNLLKLN